MLEENELTNFPINTCDKFFSRTGRFDHMDRRVFKSEANLLHKLDLKMLTSQTEDFGRRENKNRSSVFLTPIIPSSDSFTNIIGRAKQPSYDGFKNHAFDYTVQNSSEKRSLLIESNLIEREMDQTTQRKRDDLISMHNRNNTTVLSKNVLDSYDVSKSDYNSDRLSESEDSAFPAESFVSTPSPCSSSCGEIALSLSKLTRLVPEKSENHQQNRAKFQQVGYGRWEKVAKFPFGKNPDTTKLKLKTSVFMSKNDRFDVFKDHSLSLQSQSFKINPADISQSELFSGIDDFLDDGTSKKQNDKLSIRKSYAPNISEKDVSLLADDEKNIIERILGRTEVENYQIIRTVFYRFKGINDGSIGIILKTRNDESYGSSAILISKIIEGSIADQSQHTKLLPEDHVLFIQSRSTENMELKEARNILKSPAASISLIAARRRKNGLTNYLSSLSLAETEDANTFTTDPATEDYSLEPIIIELNKNELGCLGFSIDGGRDSRFGNRAIVVKKLYSGGQAEKDGRLSIGDEIRSINGKIISSCSKLDVLKIMRNAVIGPIELKIYKRIIK